MKKIRILIFLPILLFSLLYSTSAFAGESRQLGASEVEAQAQAQAQAREDHVVVSIEIVNVVQKDKTHFTFKYEIDNKYGVVITQQIPASQIITALKDGTITLDPASQTGEISLNSQADPKKTITFALGDSITRVASQFAVIEGINDNSAAEASDLAELLKAENNDHQLSQIIFTTTTLKKTGEDSYTFTYQALNQYGIDITNSIPDDQITATSSSGSKITLDPLTETGTITDSSSASDSSSDSDKPLIITLVDQLTGTTAVLNPNDIEETDQDEDAVKPAKVLFPSNNALKTDDKTATFSYKILDNGYATITNQIPATDITATAWIGSTKADVTLDPLTGTGTINYNFTDTDKSVMVKLLYKTDVGATASLNLCKSEAQLEAQNKTTVDDNDLSVAQISFLLTDQLQYQIFNKYGQDITSKIPSSQIALSSSVNSIISLDPVTGSCNFRYDSYNTNKDIILKLQDKLTGVDVSENLGHIHSWKQDIDKKIEQIAFASGSLTKAGDKTAIFHYRLLTNNNLEITEAIPVSQLEVTNSLGASITFNPLVGIGAIHYNSASDMDKPISITLTDKVTGEKTSSTLKIAEPGSSSEAESSKIAKISIAPRTGISPTDGVGYLTYIVTDQYGNDITNSPLAQGIVFESDCAECKITWNNGLLTLTPKTNYDLLSIPSLVITAKDSASGVSTKTTVTVVPMFQ